MIAAALAFLQSRAARVVGFGVAFAAAGAVLGAVYERTVPWGLESKLTRATESAANAQARLDVCVDARDGAITLTHDWKRVYAELGAKRVEDAQACAASLDRAQGETNRQCRAAFEAGVTAGRAIGGPNVETQDPARGGDSGGANGGVVRDDFAEGWGAAAVGRSTARDR